MGAHGSVPFPLRLLLVPGGDALPDQLGKEIAHDDIAVFVETSTGYARRFDVVEQLRLEDESVIVRESLDALADDVRTHLIGRA